MASTELVWAGDEEDDTGATRRFLDRRIANIMDFEKMKARLKPLSAIATGAAAFAGQMRYPGRSGT
jgi:ubiquinone biosynthesis protein COQ9